GTKTLIKWWRLGGLGVFVLLQRGSRFVSPPPASANRVQNICRRSCRRQQTPANERTRSQPELTSLTGLSGSVGCGEPRDRTNQRSDAHWRHSGLRPMPQIRFRRRQGGSADGSPDL